MPLRLAVSLRRPIVLCLVAGYVDAFGYIELGRVFPANMTGNTVLMIADVARRDMAAFAIHALTLGAFFLGALAASLLNRLFGRPFVTLGAATALLILVQSARLSGTAELLLLAAAMAIQGASLSRFGGLELQTIVVTSTILRLADGLVGRGWQSRGIPQSTGVAIPAAAWLAYIAGAGASALLPTIAAPLTIPTVLLALVVADLAIGKPP